MTTEEAKNWLKALIETMKKETKGIAADPKYVDEVYIALNMAIQSLEAWKIIKTI